MNLVFLGPPGAGKGTQASRVAQVYGIPHISTGAILRQAIADGTPMGLQAKAIMDQGGLVGDDVMVGIVKDRLAMEDCRGGYLLDGFPRTVPQAQALDGFSRVEAAVNVDVPAQEIIERIAGRRVCTACGEAVHFTKTVNGGCPKCAAPMIQRDDDREDTVRNRLDVYEAQTKPLIDYYRGQGVLVDIDGNQPIDAVQAGIQAALAEIGA